MQNLLASLVILGISVLLSLLTAEWITRAVEPQQLVSRYLVADGELGNVVRPHQDVVEESELYKYTVRTNEAGLRADEPVDHNAEAARVLALGDSFTFGWGVEREDSFLARVDRHISDLDPHVQLLNGGVGAYSSGHVYKSLQRRVDPLAPCSVIYFLNSNDLTDNLITAIDYRVTSYRSSTNGSVQLTDEKVYSPTKRFLFTYTPYGWLNQHSHLFLLVKRVVKSALASGPGSAVNGELSFGAGALKGKRANLAVAVTVAHIDRIAAFAEERDLPLAIVWVPAWTEIYRPDDPANRAYRSLKATLVRRATSAFHDPLETMQELVTQANVDLFDLYFRDGDPVGHFTVRGNELYASAVGDWVGGFVSTSCRARREATHGDLS